MQESWDPLVPEDAPLVCTPKRLPLELAPEAARIATRINPLNFAPIERLCQVIPGFKLQPDRIAVVTTKYWGVGGVQLTVAFMEQIEAALATRILAHMNAWGKTANVKFTPSTTDPQVRISRGPGGYWSFLGTDILSIPRNEPTMNLEGFTMSTPESEFARVVRHEAGHTLGFPHEHMRGELVAKLDRRKVIDYFRETQGWGRTETIRQVLTPLEERSLLGTEHADQESIMCYQLPGELTIDGEPITGGGDINVQDAAFAGRIYPPVALPPPIDPPPPGLERMNVEIWGDDGHKYRGVVSREAVN